MMIRTAAAVPCRHHYASFSSSLFHGDRWKQLTGGRTSSTTSAVPNKNKIEIVQDTLTTEDGEWQLPVTIHTATNNNATSKASILLISGWTGIGSDWGAIPKLLASQTNQDVITYDARWLGKAAPMQGQTTTTQHLDWNTMIQDAHSVLNHHARNYHNSSIDAAPNYCVVGASMGGSLAQQLMMQNQDDNKTGVKIASSVLISTWSLDSSSSSSQRASVCPNFLNTFEESSIDDEICRDATKTFFNTLGKDYLEKPGRIKLRDRLVDAFVSSRTAMGIAKQRQLLLAETAATEAPVSANKTKDTPPLVVIHGKQDSVVHYQEAFRLQDKHKCNVVLLEDGDHLLWMTHGLRLADEISAFWKQCHDDDEES